MGTHSRRGATLLSSSSDSGSPAGAPPQPEMVKVHAAAAAHAFGCPSLHPALCSPVPCLARPRRRGRRSGGADSQADSAAGVHPAHASARQRGAGRAARPVEVGAWRRPRRSRSGAGRGAGAALQDPDLCGAGQPAWPGAVAALEPGPGRTTTPPGATRARNTQSARVGDPEGDPCCAGPVEPVLEVTTPFIMKALASQETTHTPIVVLWTILQDTQQGTVYLM
ncbi:uncharacterized protein LOC122453681 [Cervus canadensis]|uniref:uncharacterized protein LOC122453681 n=1 Tax=Cervus canadensis TaxID=1574408 RepID=UPI001C9E4CEA|nr:uncharacterized protein LOC122453681 [Cervus canadensis]